MPYSPKCQIWSNMVKQKADMCEKESCVRYLQRIADISKRAAEKIERLYKIRGLLAHLPLYRIGGLGLSAYSISVSCFVAYIVHLPWWKCIGSPQNREEIVGPKVIANVTENNYPQICLQQQPKYIHKTLAFLNEKKKDVKRHPGRTQHLPWSKNDPSNPGSCQPTKDRTLEHQNKAKSNRCIL